jgi:hypothetical protein
MRSHLQRFGGPGKSFAVLPHRPRKSSRTLPGLDRIASRMNIGYDPLVMLKPRTLPLIIAAVLVGVPTARSAAIIPQLGDAPSAPTSEEVARLPRRSISKHGPTRPFTVNTASREEVRNFFNTVYNASEGFSIGWTGDLATCTPGTTDPAFRDLVTLRINYFRAMAGVPSGIAFDATFNLKDQAAALIMSANNSLSHFPPMTWTCYSANGYEAAGKSNIAIGNAGPDAITAYLEDFGGNNAAVGHRRWLIYPQTQLMGTGDVPHTGPNLAGNAIWVQDGHYLDPRPATRDNFVAWPPKGFVPFQLVFPRWSISFPNANFGIATVTMTSNGVNVAVTKEPLAPNVGENTLAWYQNGLDTSQPFAWPRPVADTVYAVNVQNVSGSGVPTSFSYTVTVIDPQVPGPDTVLPAISGPAQPGVGQGNNYTFTAVPGATIYQWRQSQPSAFTAVEGAENGLTFFTTNTSPDYTVIVTTPKASGSFAFHLAHPQVSDEWLTYTRVLLPAPAGQMQFKSRLGWATPTQIARVQVSVDQGSSWQDVYTQAGTDDQGETLFATRTVSLASFVGRSILVRFDYDYTGSSRFPQTDPGVGWYIDDISFANTEELTNSVITAVASGTSFSFAPAEARDYALNVRAEVFDNFHAEWGPTKRVTASSVVPMTLAFTGRPTISGGQIQIDFNVTNFQTGTTFQLLKTSDVSASLTLDSSASFQTIVSNSTFRVTTSTGGAPQTFYRVRTN